MVIGNEQHFTDSAAGACKIKLLKLLHTISHKTETLSDIFIIHIFIPYIDGVNIVLSHRSETL